MTNKEDVIIECKSKSSKQPAIGSQYASKLIPVRMSINREWCEWCEWSSKTSNPVTDRKNKYCECYEWSPMLIQVFSVNKHSFLEEQIKSRNSTNTSNQNRSW